VRRYTTVPYSELAMHLGIAGKRAEIKEVSGRVAVVEVDGREYDGLVEELIDYDDRP